MKKLNVFTLAQHEGPYETWPEETGLMKAGNATGQKIPGYVIEAQYEHSNGYLLVTSWDCPFEEAQTFLFLSHELEVKCTDTIGEAYTSVFIERHEPLSDHAVIFHCNEDLDILATIDSGNSLKLEKRNRNNE